MKGCLRHIVSLLFVLSLISCGRKDAPQLETRASPPIPSAPSIITDQAKIIEYKVSHYWDNFLEGDYLCDSSHVNGVVPDDVEKGLGMYITLLEEKCTREFAKKEVGNLFNKIEEYSAAHPSSNALSFFEKMVPKYLYDPNSPVRDEDLYLPFVEGLAASELVSEDLKPAYSHDARMCSLNQVGTRAADFSFTDLGGRKHNLYGIKSPFTLLMFTNPGCYACHEVIETLQTNAIIPGLVKNGTLAVVNVYIDLEREKWQALAKDYPTEWYNGYDQDFAIRQDLTYNVRGIPSLYVLNEDKDVIMKDAPTDKAIIYLQNIQKH